MDKQEPNNGPSLNGPDYLSLVIEWEVVDAPEPLTAGAERMPWDAVDEAGAESFPASDPPAWGSHRAAPSAITARQTVSHAEALKPRRRSLGLRGLALAVMAIGAVATWIQRLRRHPMRAT